MRLVVTAFMTLDGVVEGPGFDEHRDNKNAWALRIQGEEDEGYNKALVFGADALLLGRKTYQIWAAFWPSAPAGDELVDRMNSIPKYVVTRTLSSTTWSNTTLISENHMEEIARLRESPGGELLVYGSPDLVDSLLAHDLIDEYRVLIYPVILGSGKHLFRDGIDEHFLSVIETRTFDSGVVLLVLRPESEVPTSPYVVEYSWTDEQRLSLSAVENVDRVLATILFTDIVDSTDKAAVMGDRAWRKLLDRYEELARAEIERWHGEYVKSTGDGSLATFDAPSRALHCAFALKDASQRMGLPLRAAIHTGEIELRDGDIGGIGVHLAARVLETADGDSVVVTRTVRELATGTAFEFSRRGVVEAKGVPGSWELFQASMNQAI